MNSLFQSHIDGGGGDGGGGGSGSLEQKRKALKEYACH